MMTRPAVEDDPLDSVPRILPRPDDLRVERSSLRKITQGLKEEGLQFFCRSAICSGVLVAATSRRRRDRSSET